MQGAGCRGKGGSGGRAARALCCWCCSGARCHQTSGGEVHAGWRERSTRCTAAERLFGRGQVTGVQPLRHPISSMISGAQARSKQAHISGRCSFRPAAGGREPGQRRRGVVVRRSWPPCLGGVEAGGRGTAISQRQCVMRGARPTRDARETPASEATRGQQWAMAWVVTTESESD